MNRFLAGLIAGASMMLAASTANAATTAYIDFSPDTSAFVANSTTPIGGGTWDAPGVAVVSGNSDNVYRSPFGSNSNTPYFAAGPNGATAPTTATLSFGTETRSIFSFLLGSPDSFNTVSFYNDGAFIDTLKNILQPFYGSGFYSGAGAIFVSVAGFSYDMVKFTSSQQAIEFASISSVPVPAGVLLLGTALAGLGFLSRRNKSKSATASA